MKFELEALPYDFKALEPVIDAKTVEIHYTKHHNAYVTNLNNALEKYPEIDYNLVDLLKNIKTLPQDIQTVIRNNGGGHFNHALYWKALTNEKGQMPQGELLSKIEQKFGSFEQFKKEFSAAGLKQFGSGWVWLIQQTDGELAILTMPNQDAPVLYGKALLGIDVWEHAYYLNYQNKRADYLAEIWQIINWRFVESLLEDK